MKKVYLLLVAIMLVAVSCNKTDITEEVSMESAFKTDNSDKGYDEYGYNRNANIFNGYYVNAYFDKDGFPPFTGDDVSYLTDNPTAADHWAWPYRDINLLMKWNDAWDSETGAWLTNHQSGSYIGDDGKTHKWTEFYKIVLPQSDATIENGNWVRPDGSVIGYVIWGSYAVVQDIYNDPYGGYNGVYYVGEKPGIGNTKN